MKDIVLVLLTQPFIPWARRPMLFPNEIPHASQYFGFFLRCRYLSNFTVSTSITAPAHLHHISNGNFLIARFIGVDFFVVSIHANITSCVNVLVF